MLVRRAALLLSAACAAGAACGGDGGIRDEDLEGLVISPPDDPPPVDVGRAVSDGRELGRALATRHRDVLRHLGAHAATITSTVEVREGDRVVERLSDETRLQVAADGAYHAVHANSADYGREVIYLGGQLYLRPRYARWHRRAPNDEHEPLRLREQIYAVAGDTFDLVAHAAEVTDRGAARAGGRDGRRVELKRAPTPGKPPVQALTQRQWRESVTVQALAGEAILDPDHGFPLEARFTAELTFLRGGRVFTMAVEVAHALEALTSPPELAPPPDDQVVTTPERLREVDERDRLLEGMAPPTRRRERTAPPTGAEPAPGTAPPPGTTR